MFSVPFVDFTEKLDTKYEIFNFQNNIKLHGKFYLIKRFDK